MINSKVDMYYALYQLSGTAFKVLFVIREYTLRKLSSDGNFDGWIEFSHTQFRDKTGVQSVHRVVDELQCYPELIDIKSGRGVSSKYKLNKDLLKPFYVVKDVKEVIK